MINWIIIFLFLFLFVLKSSENDIQKNYNKQNMFKQGFCANQQMLSSPINIFPPFTYIKFEAKFNFYEVGSGELINNRQYLALFGDFGNFEYQNSVFNIYEIQFKSPSEHSVGSTEQEFPLEIQFISSNQEKMLINIAVLFSLEENAEDNQFLKSLGFGLKQNHQTSIQILPYKDQFFIYQGSQTTPGCEPTLWYITYDSQILNSQQLKDFPQNLIFHQRKRSQQARPIYITFYEEEVVAQQNEEQQEQIPQKSSNETSSEEENKALVKESLAENTEKLQTPQNSEISQEKLDFIGDGDEIYEEDFYGGSKQNAGKELSQENTLLVVTKQEFINSNADSSRVILSDESLDKIITNLDTDAQQNSPFKEPTPSDLPQIKEISNDNSDLSSEDLIEVAVDKEASKQLHNSFQLDQEANNEIQLQDEKPVIYEFQSPQVKQIQTKSFRLPKKNPRSTDDILSLDTKNNVPDNVQTMSFLQMKNKFIHKKQRNKQVDINKMCVVGLEQSPINIYPDEQFYCEPNALKIDFIDQLYEKQVKVQNNKEKQCIRVYGVNFGTVAYGDHIFQVAEILIKSPSEHTVQFYSLIGLQFGKDANQIDIEAQIICEDKFGLKIIIGVFFQSLGEEFLTQLLMETDPTSVSYLPQNQERTISAEKLSLNLLFDEALNFISYDGSLPYTPCTEGVRWFLLRERQSVTENQIESFLKLHGGPTLNRKTQSLGFRKIAIF